VTRLEQWSRHSFDLEEFLGDEISGDAFERKPRLSVSLRPPPPLALSEIRTLLERDKNQKP
jgi:hypothetical protein